MPPLALLDVLSFWSLSILRSLVSVPFQIINCLDKFVYFLVFLYLTPDSYINIYLNLRCIANYFLSYDLQFKILKLNNLIKIKYASKS